MAGALVKKVSRKLGGREVLGTSIRSQADLSMAVRERIPVAALEAVRQAGISEQEIGTFVIPHRTRRHRIVKNERLTVEESDRVVRLLRIQTLAEESFEDKIKANRWLRRRLAELGGNTPLEVAATETGARVIETILGKIAWGAAA